MSKSDSFIDWGHTELERWRTRLAEMEAMAERSRGDFEARMAEMRERMQEAETNLKKAQASNEAEAKAYQERAKAAWSSLEEGFQKAMKDLRGS